MSVRRDKRGRWLVDVKLRLIDGITTEMRVLWNADYFGIVQVSEPFTRELWLQCKASD